MKNFIQPGNTLTMIAPVDVTSGIGVLVGNIFGVAAFDALAAAEVEITVELGDNMILIQDIMEWTTGSVVDLQSLEHDPVKVLLNGNPFATGEIVVVADTFGVRIVELLDPSQEGNH